MIRSSLLWLFVGGLCIYAWRDWYKSLCGLILLMAVLERPDVPKTILGIEGLNPWNMLFACVVGGWLASRHRENRVWDMPWAFAGVLALYLGVIVIGFLRMMADGTGLPDTLTTSGMVREYLINALKWIVPGVLLFDGCRSRTRFTMGLVSLLGLYFLLALQVIKWMPPETALSGAMLSSRAGKVLVKEIGYHRIDLAMMMSGAAWAILATWPLAARRAHRLLIAGASLSVVYAVGLTGGRMGYVTWAVVGFPLCLMRWRRVLPFIPLVALMVAWLVPGVAERMLEGWTPETGAENVRVAEYRGLAEEQAREYTVTSGRSLVWPFVIARIWESPVVGFGRLGMQRSGLAAFLRDDILEPFTHPHNAYLEMLLDNGLLGTLPIIALYVMVLAWSLSLLRDSRSGVFVCIGGVTTALVSALLVGSIGAQTLYPREGTVGMWAAIGLMLRVYVERRACERPSGFLSAGGSPSGWMGQHGTRATPPTPAWETIPRPTRNASRPTTAS